MTNFSNFADLASHIAKARADEDMTRVYDGVFIEYEEMAKLSIVDAPEKIEMPDPEQVRAAVEMMMATMFDVLRDTRMESYAADLAWGFCNSFHVVAKRIEGREDDAANDLRELVRNYDPSETYAYNVEQAQLFCQTLQGCREAMECMRDHAAEVYRVETGKPFSAVRGSRVSSSLNASQIDAKDFLAARARNRREQYAPEGPVVVFSGGQQWEDADLLWNGLDRIKVRIPEMILATTAQTKGCDAIAHAWAAARGVKVVQFKLDRNKGNRAGFFRNDRLVSLKPVQAVVCQGSGLQEHLAQKMREAGVPLFIVRLDHQRTAKRA